MPRKHSSEICPKCGKQGFFRSKQIGKKSKKFTLPPKKYIFFVHKAPNSNRNECYLENIINSRIKEYAEHNPKVKKMLILEMKTKNLMSESSKLFNDFQINFNKCKNEMKSDDIYVINRILKLILDNVEAYSNYCITIWKFLQLEIKGLEHPMTDGYLDGKLKEIELCEINNLRSKEKFKEDKHEFLREWGKAIRLVDSQMPRFVFLFLKYVKPILLQQKKELSNKLSEAAFGSDKRKGFEFGFE